MQRLLWIVRLLDARPAARPASAARRVEATTPAAHPTDGDAANDAPANESAVPLPLCTLTDAQRANYRARAAALPSSAVKPLPSRAELRSTHLLQHVAAAWGVRDRLVGIAVDGAPITAAELDDALPLVTWTREQLARRALPTSAVEGAPAESTEAAMAALVADVATVCEGLKLQHDGDKKRRAVVSAIRAERRPSMLGGAVARLLVLCDEPGTSAQLAGLPKGEAAAVARLRKALPAWERQWATREVGDGAPEETPLAGAQRAWAMADAAMGRIVRAGRYLAKGDPAQEKLWRAYRPAKKRAKSPEAPKPDA
ncbi:MAG: hypothetical protein U0324_01270 [Polyangiales bacterium]